MRMVKAMIVAVTLVGFGVARADEVVVHRNPAGTVLRDTVAGGLVGSAVSGGVILYNMGIQNHHNYDWGRTLAWGAGIGLAAGLVWGIVDAASGPSYAMATPVAHDGMSASLDTHRLDQSNKVLMPVALGRF